MPANNRRGDGKHRPDARHATRSNGGAKDRESPRGNEEYIRHAHGNYNRASETHSRGGNPRPPDNDGQSFRSIFG